MVLHKVVCEVRGEIDQWSLRKTHSRHSQLFAETVIRNIQGLLLLIATVLLLLGHAQPLLESLFSKAPNLDVCNKTLPTPSKSTDTDSRHSRTSVIATKIQSKRTFSGRRSPRHPRDLPLSADIEVGNTWQLLPEKDTPGLIIPTAHGPEGRRT